VFSNLLVDDKHLNVEKWADISKKAIFKCYDIDSLGITVPVREINQSANLFKIILGQEKYIYGKKSAINVPSIIETWRSNYKRSIYGN
jgi:hypothetical protein